MKLFYISDVHIPYENKEAVEEMFTSLRKEKPDEFIIGGDLVDFFKVSRYDKSPLEGERLAEEVKQCKAFLQRLRRTVGKRCKIVYIEGNHEERLALFHPRFTRFGGI